jgi:hypothetical protein
MIKSTAISSLLETMKQWLSGSKPVICQHVFAPDLNRKRKQRLEAMNGPMLCITPQKPKSSSIARIQWQPLPESTKPPKQLYAIAREIIDAQSTAIKNYLPDFFRNTELQVDYEPAYRINRQQTLAITGLNFLSRCFEMVTHQGGSTSPHTKPIILDSPIIPALLSDEVIARFDLPLFTPLFSAATPLSAEDFKKRRTALKTPKFDKPTVMLVMSAPVHYDLAKPALEHLAQDYTIVVYFANPDKLEPALRQKLAQQYFTIDAHDLLPDERLIRSACNYFNRRLQQIATLPVPVTLRDALTSELDRLTDTIHILCLLETVLTHIQPVAIMGCLEKNRMSAAFQSLQARYGFKLLNFQHGTMPLTHNMDWQKFDRFFVWNPLSRNVVLKDGYAYPESIAVVGNPFWEQQGHVDPKPLSVKAQEIIAWRGDSPLIGAYSQYAGDYLTPQACRNYLKALFEYLAARPQVKLLIKRHPLESDQLIAEMLAQTNLQDRVIVCTGRELDLWESFALIRFSTTICSTTLLDSLKVNVPAVALDFTGIIADIGYGYEEVEGITIIQEPEAVAPIFDELLIRSQNPDTSASFPGNQQSLVYPALPGSYSECVRRHLVDLGLLPAQTIPSQPVGALSTEP